MILVFKVIVKLLYNLNKIILVYMSYSPYDFLVYNVDSFGG